MKSSKLLFAALVVGCGMLWYWLGAHKTPQKNTGGAEKRTNLPIVPATPNGAPVSEVSALRRGIEEAHSKLDVLETAIRKQQRLLSEMKDLEDAYDKGDLNAEAYLERRKEIVARGLMST